MRSVVNLALIPNIKVRVSAPFADVGYYCYVTILLLLLLHALGSAVFLDELLELGFVYLYEASLILLRLLCSKIHTLEIQSTRIIF